MFKWISLFAVLFVSSVTFARADDKQAFLGIFAETHAMKMAGMPAMPKMPQLPAGVTLPAGVAAAMGLPSRKLEVRLWSPGIAPDAATASLAIPDGLKLGLKLDLALYRPKPEEGRSAAPGVPGAVPPDFTIKRYWGSSATVRPGQPEIIHLADLTAEQKAVMQAQTRRAPAAGSYFYKPDWTTGYWPAAAVLPGTTSSGGAGGPFSAAGNPALTGPAAIDAGATLTGHYALTTTYTGNVEIDVPTNVDFLAPIDLVSPDLTQSLPFAEPMKFQWKPIPNVLGSYATIIGMQGRNTLIIWSSSEIRTEPGLSMEYMQMAEVAEKVKSTTMMAPDRQDVTVPAGIFTDCDFVSMSMIGYGPGAALDKGQPSPRVQTKTTLQVMLSGKGISGMGDVRPGQ